MRRWLVALPIAVLMAWLVAGGGRTADAQPSPPASASASEGGAPAVAPQPPPAAEPSPEVQALLDQASRIRALIVDELDLTVEPPTLFSVSLTDEQAIAAQVKRLRAVLVALEHHPDGGAGGTGGAGGAGGAGGVANDEPDPYLDARLALDRAQLSFLARPRAERDAILARHEQRREDASLAARRQAEAEQQKREAEAAKKRALEQADRAKSEVLRKVAREEARLNGIKSTYADRSTELNQSLDALNKHARDTRLKWESELAKWLDDSSATPADHDALYDRLVAALATTRAQFSEALGRFSSGASTIPEVGPDPLTDLGEGVDLSAVERVRAEVLTTYADLTQLEDEVVTLRVRTLMDELQTLRAGRRNLLPHLSNAKRSALYGFGVVGRTQAEDELKQAGVVMLYHFSLSRRWLRSFDFGRYHQDQRLLFYWELFKVLSVFIIFAWWHRRSGSWLKEWLDKAREQKSRSRQVGALRFISRVRTSVEWLAVFWVVRMLLPASVASLLEVKIVETVLIWTLGESLVVNAIGALATPRGHFRMQRDLDLGKLRLRALRLAGRVVVVFGLSLSLSSQLAGEGTLYHWVWRVALYAAIPVVLLLVHWYKPHILHRIGQRRKSGFTGWVHARARGWMSYPAALLGAVYLLVRGTNRFVRNWLGGFDVSRRALAYWFRRELTKKDEKTPQSVRTPLRLEEHRGLDPEHASVDYVEGSADPALLKLLDCIDAEGGGVFAVVGERGSGKSTLLRRIGAAKKADFLACPFSGEELQEQLRDALGLPAGAAADAICASINARTSDTAILIDDAHHLVQPRIGGLDDFDALVQLARDSSLTTCTWVFALDTVIWQFVQRARGAKPIFDDVVSLGNWSEDEIAQLLARRTMSARVEPRFDKLLTNLPEDADDIDRLDGLARAETNYYRLLWSYADGNPGVALHFWRESLGADDAGAHWVHLFQPPDTKDIESLPDAAVFVLRAVVQLELAVVDDIVRSTMLPAAVVQNALRYALARGYIEAVDGRYRLRWQWFRAVTNFLIRRHLLVARNSVWSDSL